MSKKSRREFIQTHSGPRNQKRLVTSLLGAMVDGREYESLLGVTVENLNGREEIRGAIADIEAATKRPLIVYAANVVKPAPGAQIDIGYADDLPFAEMVAAVPASANAIDVLTVTPGGLAQQVSQFVNRIRSRFTDVSMIIPYMAMSAGTIWALSGNKIWMDERASIGPIDPQVPGKDGRYVPAQAILALLKKIQDNGQANLSRGQNPDWSDIMVLQNMDAKEIGNAISMSNYSTQLAAEYLTKYKFRDWTNHSDGRPVTPAERADRAAEVARMLCSHDHWKVHSHGISRDVAWTDLKIKIEHPEDLQGMNRALRRFWALMYWIFETTPTAKIFISDQYALFKNVVQLPQS